jgi:hypothetical protein
VLSAGAPTRVAQRVTVRPARAAILCLVRNRPTAPPPTHPAETTIPSPYAYWAGIFLHFWESSDRRYSTVILEAPHGCRFARISPPSMPRVERRVVDDSQEPPPGHQAATRLMRTRNWRHSLQRTTFAVLFLLAAQFCHSVSATVVFIVRSPGEVWFAADSRVSKWNARTIEVTQPTGCKIRRAGDYIYAMTGLRSETLSGYDATAIVESTLKPATDIRAVMKLVAEALRAGYDRALKTLAVRRPETREKLAGHLEDGVSVYIVNPRHQENGAPVVWGIGIRGDLSTANMPSAVLRFNRNMDFKDGDWIAFGATNAINDALKSKRHSGLSTGDTQVVRLKKLRELLTIQAHATPDVVGLPLDALRVTGQGVSWITRTGACLAVTAPTTTKR